VDGLLVRLTDSKGLRVLIEKTMLTPVPTCAHRKKSFRAFTAQAPGFRR
jgi:hypothetical protein